MRKLIANIENRLRKCLAKIRRECRDAKTFAIFLAVLCAMYSPSWGGYLLHAICGWKTGSIIASAYALFWAGPFTPFFPICFAITFAIRQKLRQKNEKQGRK